MGGVAVVGYCRGGEEGFTTAVNPFPGLSWRLTHLVSSRSPLSSSLRNPSRYTTNGLRRRIRAVYASGEHVRTEALGASMASSDSFSHGRGRCDDDDEEGLARRSGKRNWLMGLEKTTRTAKRPRM